MPESAFDFMTMKPGEYTVMDFLEKSSYDELLEIDLDTGHFKNLFHVEGKYFVPIREGEINSLMEYAGMHMVHPDDRETFRALMDFSSLDQRLAKARPTGVLVAELRYKLLDGGWHWTQQVVVDGKRNGVEGSKLLVFFFDIQQQKDRERGARSVYPSSGDRDELTGLLREKSFVRTGREVLAVKSVKWCMLSIDIENFMLFNDWYGRDQGDLLLAQIGGVLKQEENHCGALAGYRGQDDFSLLMPYDMTRISYLYEEIHKLIMRRGSSMGFLPAVGVALIEKDMTVLDAVDQSSMAAEQIRGNFHSRIVIYDPSMRNRTEEEYRVLSDFQRAITDRELFVVLQPQCRISTGKIVGAESLARWRKADGAMVPPDQFVPVLEKYGFITDLDQYVWDEVCRKLRNWLDGGHQAVPVSINVSQVDIFTIDVPAFIEELTDRYNLPRNLLKIEITESAYVDDTDKVKDTVFRLREKGFMVLMDDFGSGYSSLNMLRSLNVDIIKLDAQFLRLGNDDDDIKGIQILETIVNMTKSMAVPIIVEGVETKEHVTFLRNLGCSYIQGYYFYKPMPCEEFESLIGDETMLDTEGFVFKRNQQFSIREFMDQNIYSDSMLNNLLGATAFYSWDGGEQVDIIRFNQQFYTLVNVPDFNERLTDIKRFFHPNDVPTLFELLRKAENDRMNGASDVCGIYRTDGSIGRFLIQFYYLETRQKEKIFYGALREVTHSTELQNQMKLLSRFSTSITIFLRKRGQAWYPQVVVYGLGEELEMDKEAFQEELDSGKFYSRMVTDDFKRDQGLFKEMVRSQGSFSHRYDLRTDSGKVVSLYMKADYVHDDYSNVEYIVHFRLFND